MLASGRAPRLHREGQGTGNKPTAKCERLFRSAGCRQASWQPSEGSVGGAVMLAAAAR
jgi:hypothetical protein